MRIDTYCRTWDKIFYFTSNDCLISLSGFNNLSSEVKGNTDQSFQTIAIIDNVLYVLLPSPFTVYIPVIQTALSGIPSALHYGDNILLIFWILPLPAAIVYCFQSHELAIPIQSQFPILTVPYVKRATVTTLPLKPPWLNLMWDSGGWMGWELTCSDVQQHSIAPVG